MSITFHFRPKENLVISVHAGLTSGSEFLASYKSLYKNHLFHTSMNRLIDLRKVDGSQVTEDSLRQLAEFMKGQEPYRENTAKPKIAVIAPRDNVFNLTLQYEVFTKDIPWDFIVFHSSGAALAWLDLPENLLDNFDKTVGNSD
jgi:hypothetical protein